MGVEILKEKYRSEVREVVLGATAEEGGTRSHTIKVGGETTLPFLHLKVLFPIAPLLPWRYGTFFLKIGLKT